MCQIWLHIGPIRQWVSDMTWFVTADATWSAECVHAKPAQLGVVTAFRENPHIPQKSHVINVNIPQTASLVWI